MKDTLLNYNKLRIPLLSMWARPRNTLGRILADDPNLGVIVIAILIGLTGSLRTSILHGLHPMPDLLGIHPLLDDIINVGIGHSAGILMTSAAILVFGSVMGVLLVAVGGLFLQLSGRVGGGKGQYEHVRAAVAWSFVPYIYMMPVWFLYGLFNFRELRMLNIGGDPINISMMGWTLPSLVILDTIIRVVCIVFLILNLANVHRIAPVKSIAMVVFAFIPLTLILIPWQGFAL